MIHLLNPATKRSYEIVEMLFSSDSWVTLDAIADKFNVSKRTISNDLVAIKHRWGDDIKIQSSKKYGIKLENDNMYNLYEIARDIFTNSLEYSLIINTFLYTNKSLTFHANKLFVSESTLNRLFTKVKAFLSNENITITKNNNKYLLTSKSEHHIRHVVASLLLELRNPKIKNYYLDIEYEEIFKYFEKSNFIEQNNYVFSLYYSYLFIVSLIRECQGHTIDDTGDKDIIASDFVKSIQKKVKTLNGYNTKLITKSLVYIKKEANKVIEKGRDGEHLLKYNILAKVLTTYNIEHNDKDVHDLVVMIDDSYSLYREFIFKPSLLFLRIDWFYKEFKDNSKHLNELLITELKATTKFDGKNFDYLVPIIAFWLCLTYPEITLNVLEKKVLIISDLGMKHNNYLRDKLKEYFKGKQNIDLIIGDINNVDAKNIDLIVTNINSYVNKETDVFFINDFLSINDLVRINLQLLSNKNIK